MRAWAYIDRTKVLEQARALGWEYFNHGDKLSGTLKARLDEGWQVTAPTTTRCASTRAGCAASTGDPVFNRA